MHKQLMRFASLGRLTAKTRIPQQQKHQRLTFPRLLIQGDLQLSSISKRQCNRIGGMLRPYRQLAASCTSGIYRPGFFYVE